jgi:hypothetical protein
MEFQEHTPTMVLLDRLKKRLTEIYANAASLDAIFPWLEFRTEQKQILETLLDDFILWEKGEIDAKILANIIPPWWGKTAMMLVLTKLFAEQNIPTLIWLRNTANLYWPDNALALFEKYFSSDDIGIVDAKHKVFDKKITFMLAMSFWSQENITRYVQTQSWKTFNIMIDEWDSFQTDLRKKSLDQLSQVNTGKFASLRSATEYVNNRRITDQDWAIISSSIWLQELIALWRIKRICWHYLQADINVNKDTIVWSEVSYDKLVKQEKDWFISSAVELYQTYHQGQKMMIHCSSISQANATVKAFQNQWIHARAVTNETTSLDQQEVEESYINGTCMVLCSVKKYLRSFSDNWVTQAEYFARITWSPTELYQCVLRGNRSHKAFETLSIYQAWPSTVSMRWFVPVTLHDVFHIPIDELWSIFHNDIDSTDYHILDDWWKVQEENITPNPIEFFHSSQKVWLEPLIEGNNGALTFVGPIEIRKIIDTDETDVLIHEYIYTNFTRLVESFMKTSKVSIFGITAIKRDCIAEEAHLTTSMWIIQVPISWTVFRWVVYKIVTWLLNKSDADDNIWLVHQRIQEWYVTGTLPIFNERIDQLWLHLKKKEISYTQKFITQHGLEIMDLFINEHGITPNNPDLYASKQVIFKQALTLSYHEFASSVAKYYGVNAEISRVRPKLFSNLLRDWKDNQVLPAYKDVWERLCASFVDIEQYFWLHIDVVLSTYYDRYTYTWNIPRSVYIEWSEILSLILTKQDFSTYINQYKPDFKHYLDKIPEHLTVTISTDRRQFMRETLRKRFSRDDLIALNMTRSEVSAYSKQMQHDIVAALRKDWSLSKDTALTILQTTYDASIAKIPFAAYAFVKNIFSLPLDQILPQIQQITYYTKAEKIMYQPCEMSGWVFLSTFLLWITGMSVKSFISVLNLAWEVIAIDVVRDLCLEYLKNESQKELRDETYLLERAKYYLTQASPLKSWGKKNTKQSPSETPENDTHIVPFPSVSELNDIDTSEDIVSVISQTFNKLFPDIKTLEKNWFTRESYKSFYSFIQNFKLNIRNRTLLQADITTAWKWYITLWIERWKQSTMVQHESWDTPVSDKDSRNNTNPIQSSAPIEKKTTIASSNKILVCDIRYTNSDDCFDQLRNEQYKASIEQVLLWYFKMSNRKDKITSSKIGSINKLKEYILDIIRFRSIQPYILDENREKFTKVLSYMLWTQWSDKKRFWGITHKEWLSVLTNDNEQAVYKIVIYCLKGQYVECDEYLWRWSISTEPVGTEPWETPIISVFEQQDEIAVWAWVLVPNTPKDILQQSFSTLHNNKLYKKYSDWLEKGVSWKKQRELYNDITMLRIKTWKTCIRDDQSLLPVQEQWIKIIEKYFTKEKYAETEDNQKIYIDINDILSALTKLVVEE